MVKTKYTGVYQRVNNDSTKTFYIKYKIKGKQHLEKVGTSIEGITAVYASKIRAKKTSVDRLKDDAPFAAQDKRITFDEAFNLYYNHTKYNTRDYKTQERRYIKHIKEEIGHIEISRIDSKILENFKRKMMDKINPKTKQPYSEGTINHLFDLIRVVFNHTINEKKLTIINPASSRNTKRLKVDNKRERYLDEDEIKLLFSEIKIELESKYKHQTTKDKVISFLMLSFSTGARLGSVCTIRKQDINFNQKTILIKNHKTGKTYTGYLHPKYEEFIKNRCSKLKNSDYIVSGNSEQYDQSTLSYQLKSTLDRLFNQGIDPNDRQNRVVIHTFRHSFASLLAINGTPLYTIMKLMNHEDISQTIRYAKLSPDNGSLNVFSLKF